MAGSRTSTRSCADRALLAALALAAAAHAARGAGSGARRARPAAGVPDQARCLVPDGAHACRRPEHPGRHRARGERAGPSAGRGRHRRLGVRRPRPRVGGELPVVQARARRGGARTLPHERVDHAPSPAVLVRDRRARGVLADRPRQELPRRTAITRRRPVDRTRVPRRRRPALVGVGVLAGPHRHHAPQDPRCAHAAASAGVRGAVAAGRDLADRAVGNLARTRSSASTRRRSPRSPQRSH